MFTQHSVPSRAVSVVFLCHEHLIFEVNLSLFYYKFIRLSLKICECQTFPTFYNVVLLQYGQVLINYNERLSLKTILSH